MALNKKTQTGKKPHPYASFWQRAAAGTVDLLLLFIAYDTLVTLTGIGISWERELEGLPSMEAMMNPTISFYLNIILTEIFFLFYFVVFVSSPMRATLGMQLLGLTLVDQANNRISWQCALVRYISVTFSMAFLFIGFLMMLWTEKRQALHDQITGTFVLQSK